MFIESNVCSSNSESIRFMIREFANFLVDYCLCFRFSTKTKNLNLLFDLRLVWSRFLVMKHLYEYDEDFFRVMKSRSDWFFRLDVFETIYDEDICIEKCQNRIWSIYSSWFCNCIQNNFTKYRLTQIISRSFFFRKRLRLLLFKNDTRTKQTSMIRVVCCLKSRSRD